VRDVLRLVRAHNLLVAAAGVLAGGWIALGALATPKLLVFAAVAGVAFGAAGNAMNDIWDAAADRVNRHPIERLRRFWRGRGADVPGRRVGTGRGAARGEPAAAVFSASAPSPCCWRIRRS